MHKISVLLLILVFGFGLVVTGSGQTAKTAPTKQKPNIIYILTDDLGYGDLGAFFQQQRAKNKDRSEPWIATPNLDKMAAGGAKLSNHYCPAPVCAPSRASFLTGLSQGHANVRDNQFDKALEDNHTVASILRQSGYATAAIGKWGLQGENKNKDNEKETPEWPAHPLNRGFDYYYGYMRHNDGHEHYPKEGVYRGRKQVWDNRTEVTEGLDKCYTGDLFTARTKKWIIDQKKTRKPDQPFFIYLAYDTPHAALELPTQKYPAGGGLTSGVQWIGKPGQMINTASGTIDSWVHPDYEKATYDHDKNASTPEVAWPDVYKRYATSVRRIDDQVGDILQLLKDLKIDTNTLVVFSSDNGPSLESYLPETAAPNNPDFFNSFGPFDGTKRDVWEGGVRVPTLAFWPGSIPANREIKTPNATHDWLATFANAAGVSAPARTDGVSLLPSLTGVGKQRESLVYIEYFHNASTPNLPEFEASRQKRKRGQMQVIRFGDLVGVRYDIKSENDDFEIYNVVLDPKEKNNLAKTPGMAPMQARMKAKVLQVRRPDASAPRPYDNAFVLAVTGLNPKAGLNWKNFPNNFSWLPEVSGLTASGSGQATDLKLVKNSKGVTYLEGFVQVPADGDYTFAVKADKGAVLKIHEANVIDVDYGYKTGAEAAGKIKLKAGLHPIKLFVSNQSSSSGIDFTWEGPGLAKQPIPASALFQAAAGN